jgi:spermidine synthase
VRDRWFFVFFVVSGFCALLCQVVWLRLAMASFGVTAAMIAIVLSVFMAGLALGNALGGAVVERARASTRSVLILYALCESAIALSAYVVPFALHGGRTLLAGAAWGSGAYHLASAIWVTLALLPFCVAMGATLPLALAAIGPRVRGGRSSVGHLYAANVLGATIGTLASAFVLIELVGLQGTLHLGAGLNALLAAASLGLSLRAASDRAVAPPEGSVSTGDTATLAALFATGFASMAMEVVWVRQFAPLLGNVVYAFALILAAYLLATLAGSLVYRARSRSLPADGPPLAVWIALALAAMLPAIAADPRLPGVTRFDAVPMVPAAGSILTVFLAVAPLSALLGFVTPWLVDRWSVGSSRRAGTAWAVNGLGCVLGPLAGGFLLLPLVGERRALFVLSLVVIATGLLRAPRAAWKAMAATTAVVAGVTAVTAGEESRFSDARVRRDSTATVIVKGQGGEQGLLVNGVSMTYLTPITKFMTHLPLAFLARPPQRGLVICFGMGTSFRSMHSWGIETTAVELVPSVPTFFAEFHPDAAGMLSSPRARVVVDDGRRFLDRSAEQFDVVVIDPPPPVEAAGSSLLYSREFYEAIRPRLARDGIVQAWIPGGDRRVIAAFALALRDVFPHVRVFSSVEGWGLHLLASPQPIGHFTASELAARLPMAAQDDLLAWGPHGTAVEQFEAVVSRERAVDWASLARRAAPLTDNRPINEYYLVRRLMDRRAGPG